MKILAKNYIFQQVFKERSLIILSGQMIGFVLNKSEILMNILHCKLKKWFQEELKFVAYLNKTFCNERLSYGANITKNTLKGEKSSLKICINNIFFRLLSPQC